MTNRIVPLTFYNYPSKKQRHIYANFNHFKPQHVCVPVSNFILGTYLDITGGQLGG